MGLFAKGLSETKSFSTNSSCKRTAITSDPSDRRVTREKGLVFFSFFSLFPSFPSNNKIGFWARTTFFRDPGFRCKSLFRLAFFPSFYRYSRLHLPRLHSPPHWIEKASCGSIVLILRWRLHASFPPSPSGNQRVCLAGSAVGRMVGLELDALSGKVR